MPAKKKAAAKPVAKKVVAKAKAKVAAKPTPKKAVAKKGVSHSVKSPRASTPFVKNFWEKRKSR